MLSVEGNFGYGHWNGTNNFSYVSPAPYDRGFNTWALSAPASYITQMVTSGFNTMRIVIDPGPLVLGLVISVAQFNTLMGQIQAAIDGNTAAGLRTLVDLSCRPSTSVQATGFGLADTEVLSAATAGSAWVRYLAMVRAVAAWIVAHNNPNDVALEIFNEPPNGFTWASSSTAMFAEARIGGGQNLTILIAGDWFASPTGLAALTASNYDANTMFVVHWYSPYEFCFQTQTGAPNSMQYVTGLEFPPNPARQAGIISAAKAMINADGSLSSAQKTTAISNMTAGINIYYSTPRNAAWVTSQLDVAQTWASGQSVASNRCIIGEFSANSASAYNFNRNFGSDATSLASFLGTVKGWCTTNSWNWGYFSGRDASNFGNGFTLAPGNVTPVYSDVRLRSLSLNAVVPPAFYVSTTGNDSNPGTKASPFLTHTKAATAMTASATVKTTIFMAGTHNWSSWPFTAGQTVMGDTADAALSTTIHTTVANLGANNVPNIAIKNLKFTSSLNTGAAILEFVGCSNLQILGCRGETSAWQGFLLLYNLRAGTRLQGLSYNCPTIGPTGANGVFPINIVHNDGANVGDVVLSDVDGVGGTFAVQWQDQIVDSSGVTIGIWTNVHCDRLNLTGWGNNTSSIGNEGISFVGSNNPSNSGNTCVGSILVQGSTVGTGIEAGVAGCTYSNKIQASFAYSISRTPNSLYNGSELTVGTNAFSNGGSYSSTGIEIRVNTVNGIVATGPNDPNQKDSCSPKPNTTGLPINTPSAPYIG